MTAAKASKAPSDKASKGTVQVITSNDRLQLRFRYGGKRRYLSIGLPDNRTNRIVAEQRAKQIELDIISGNFDETLDKYRSPSARKAVEERVVEKPPEVPTLPELWEKYCDVRYPVVSPGTWRNGYKVGSIGVSGR
ncbi:MAG: Arm DNA-binding domain-containing protein [Elainellaceae cyanobacterium]